MRASGVLEGVILPAKPFRFGVWAEHATSLSLLLETARRLEEGGFSTLLLRDHLVAGPFPAQLAPLPSLAVVAAHTATLRVGTMVIGNDFRHPALLAKEIATLDVLSGGRVELGMGAGFLRDEYDQAGLRVDSPGERVERLEESLQVLKGLWSEGPFTHHGRHYDIDGLDSFPKPVQQPHPPILVAVARRRMLSIAARHADVVAIQAVSTTTGDVVDEVDARSAERAAEQVSWVGEAAGDGFSSLELSTSATIVYTDDALAAASNLTRARGWSAVSPRRVLDMPSIFIGTPEHIESLFYERRARYGLNYFVLSDQAIDTVAPLVAKLTGK
jgi:probable F420-dependent oxidoreductase